MDKEQRSSLHLDSFAPLDGEPDQEHAVAGGGAGEMVEYMLGQPPPPTPGPQSQVSFDKLTFSDVLQFADFGPKLALNQPAPSEHHDDGGGGDDDDDDDSYFLRFQSLPSLPAVPAPPARHAEQEEGSKTTVDGGGGVSESTTTLVQQQQQHTDHHQGSKKGGEQQGAGSKSGRRKRPRSVKTNEEVESQRMTHIAVERNRRRQMNDYLRVLRSLMPGSYVQRGDQASIIGGAIEFIRELEQLIQCLESQKRRRLYGGDAPRPVADGAAMQHQEQAPAAPAPFFAPSLPFPASSGGSADVAAGAKVLDLDAGGGGDVREEVVENKSCLADIEVRVLGEDAMIKILSRRRPGQLIKIIAALEDMHMSIIHTNITTIELTVLYSFNVKVAGEARYSAEDIAGAVHQILSFIDVNYAL